MKSVSAIKTATSKDKLIRNTINPKSTRKLTSNRFISTRTEKPIMHIQTEIRISTKVFFIIDILWNIVYMTYYNYIIDEQTEKVNKKLFFNIK